MANTQQSALCALCSNCRRHQSRNGPFC